MAISGIWLLIQKDIKNILAPYPPGTLDSSLPDMPPIEVNMFKLVSSLPTAPVSSSLFLNKYIKTQARALVIACYEELKENKNWQEIRTIPILETFRHIRNAAAHNNHFFITDKKGLPLQWRNKTVSAETDGKELFSEWMSLGDIEYFLEDVSKEINNLKK